LWTLGNNLRWDERKERQPRGDAAIVAPQSVPKFVRRLALCSPVSRLVALAVASTAISSGGFVQTTNTLSSLLTKILGPLSSGRTEKAAAKGLTPLRSASERTQRPGSSTIRATSRSIVVVNIVVRRAIDCSATTSPIVNFSPDASASSGSKRAALGAVP